MSQRTISTYWNQINKTLTPITNSIFGDWYAQKVAVRTFKKVPYFQNPIIHYQRGSCTIKCNE